MKKTTTGEKKRVKWLFSKRNIFVWLFLVIRNLFKGEGDLLYANGSHIITGYPGAGKSLLGEHIISNVDSEKYFFLCNVKEYYNENVYNFKLSDMFDECEQKRSFPTLDHKGRQLYGVIFDEINLSFNKRLNRRTDYNDVFIGLIEFLITHRHQDVPRVYFIGQKLELQDTQLQSLFKYQHDIFKKRIFPRFKPYNLTGKLIYYPVKLKLINRVKDINDQFIDLGKEKIKISVEECNSYNTKALGQAYTKLPPVKFQSDVSK